MDRYDIPGMRAGRPPPSGLVLALVASAAVLALSGTARSATAPVPKPEVQAALQKADAGDPQPLTALADAGDAEAQYYAGLLYITGKGSIAKDPPRGCAYAQKASATRPDAMHMLGLCHQSPETGMQDKAKAEAAFARAAEMGFPKSKCTLGQLRMAEPARAESGLALCKEAASAGDVDAQVAVATAYFNGVTGKPNRAEARKWYEMASRQGNHDASRRLGQMYATGDGGSKDKKKAMELWIAAEKAGDPMAAILVADELFLKLSGGKPPGPGKYKFKGGVPLADFEVVEQWYRQASTSDPRPDVKKRADYALAILASLKSGGQAVSVAK